MTLPAEQPLDHAERWLRDSLAVIRPSFSALQVTVDMTQALKQLEDLRKSGVQASTTHQLVRAVACALAANPSIHQVLSNTRRYRPDRVDIGLSISGETFIAPVLVIEGADKKTIAEIAAEIARRVPEVQEADRKLLKSLRRWGWLVPFGFLRRAIQRIVFSSANFRRKGVGTFQVSTVPADWALSSVFLATGVLIGGQVHSAVLAVDGQPVVRPAMQITLSSDHGVWDGRAAVRFMASVKAELERASS